jgi:predicted transcriptional regulator
MDHTSQSVIMTLTPTLWRTCRVLANRKRLRLLQHLMTTPSASVSEVSNALQWNLNTASQYLRALNARGLLSVTRKGRFVLYQMAADLSMPESEVLIKALKQVLQKSDGVKVAFDVVTSFTHPRRIEILKAIGGNAVNIATLQRITGIPRPALIRHVRKLKKRGCLIQSRGIHRCARPKNPLTKALIAVVRQRSAKTNRITLREV